MAHTDTAPIPARTEAAAVAAGWEPDTCDRCDRVSATVGVGWADLYGWDGLCDGCRTHLRNSPHSDR